MPQQWAYTGIIAIFHRPAMVTNTKIHLNFKQEFKKKFKHYCGTKVCDQLPSMINKLFCSFKLWGIEGRSDGNCRGDMKAVGAALTITAHVLYQPAPPVTFTDVAQCGVNAVVRNSPNCWRPTWSRLGDIAVSIFQYLLLLRIVINDELSFALLATVIKPRNSRFI